jgi:predicted DNA binding CopG/RHH family protein
LENRVCFASDEAKTAALLRCDSLIAEIAFELLAQDIGGKGEKFMSKRAVKYTDDKGEITGDLRPLKKGELPSLDQLVGKLHRQTKVTLALDDEAIAFFKREASKRKTSYQRMIRNLVRSYVHTHPGVKN